MQSGELHDLVDCEVMELAEFWIGWEQGDFLGIFYAVRLKTDRTKPVLFGIVPGNKMQVS